MNNYFSGKTVVITGASAGVGAATARLFAKQKANLILLARGADALEKIGDELKTLTDVLTVVMDVTKSDDCRDMLLQASEKFGSIDVLINNASYHHRGAVEGCDPIKLAQMVDVNLRAPIELSGLVLPYLRKAGGGAIVNVGSLAGRTPLQGAATYCATKAGLRAFTYALSDEVRGTGINVGLVSPGPIDTGFIMTEIDKVEDIVFSQPLSTAEQVAEAIMVVATGQQVEISMPKASGWLTMISYLFPGLRRALRPSLYEKGRKAKEIYRKRQQDKSTS